MYNVSRALKGAEERYPFMEKIAFNLLITSRKLCPYFQAHMIFLIADLPLRKVLQKPDTSRWLIQWLLELEEFDVQYLPRIPIKDQVMVDFLVGFIEDLQPSAAANPPQAKWVWTSMWIGPQTKTTSGVAQAGIVLTSLDGLEVEYALCFNFKATKYENEYEALLAGLSIAAILRVDGVIMRCDS